MPLSRFKRPLFLILAAYLLLLCGLKRAGFLDAALPDKNPYPYPTPVEIMARLDGSLTTGRRPRAFMTAGKMKILVWFGRQAEGAGLLPGAILKINGQIRRPRPAKNPGDFDERGYLINNGACAVLHASRFEVLKQNRSALGHLRTSADSARRSLADLLKKTYPPQIESVLRAILLGDKGALDSEFSEALKKAGAFHLIVPSGTNVAFVIVFFLWLSRRLRLGGLLSALLPLAMAAFYGLVLGFDPPYLRAYLCAALACLFRSANGEHDLFQALTLSALILLLWDPRMLFRESFQMSYLAVLTLLLTRPHEIFPKNWPHPLRLALELAAASAAVQLALLPLLAQMGGKFSLIGIISNVALVPLCGLIMGAGYSLWVLSFLPCAMAFKAAAVLTGWLAEVFRAISLTSASLPHAALDLWPMPPLMISGYYLLLPALFLRRHLLWFLPGLGLIGFSIFFQAAEARNLRVLALSLPGPGASLVLMPNRESWLIYGSGPPKTVLTALKLSGVKQVDKIIFLENSAARARYRQRILDSLPNREAVNWKGEKPFELRLGGIYFLFTREGLRVFKGDAEYSALPGRLRQNALAITTDGQTLAY